MRRRPPCAIYPARFARPGSIFAQPLRGNHGEHSCRNHSGAWREAEGPQANLGLSLLTEEAKDPICGMSMDVGAAKYKSEFQGNSFNFCRAGRKQTFDKQPDKYALATIE